jgi:methylglyoxal synthase
LLGIVASKSLRRNNVKAKGSSTVAEEDGTVDQFIADHLEVLKNYRLLVTRGTYIDSFAEASKRRELEAVPGGMPIPWEPAFSELDGEVLRHGKDGGLLELSARLLQGKNDRPACGVIIFLMDPADYEEQFPENRQLIRMSSVANAILLMNYRSASLWANYESEFRPKTTSVKPPYNNGERVALIAHNEKKIPMCKFVSKYHKSLMRFGSLITTGTTGMYVLDFLKLFDPKFETLDRQNSGPSGGDAEISQLILNGECQHVCFFVDPMTAHPHEADVSALLRTCTFDGCEVNLRLTPNAAQSWMDSVAEVLFPS